MTTGKLKAFDPKSRCPKCGNASCKTRWEDKIENDPCWYDRTYRPPNKWPKHEYMHRTCQRCQYQWPEACSGAKP